MVPSPGQEHALEQWPYPFRALRKRFHTRFSYGHVRTCRPRASKWSCRWFVAITHSFTAHVWQYFTNFLYPLAECCHSHVFHFHSLLSLDLSDSWSSEPVLCEYYILLYLVESVERTGLSRCIPRTLPSPAGCQLSTTPASKLNDYGVRSADRAALKKGM
jgi:hypothetical protein